MEKFETKTVNLADPKYPALLKEIHHPPRLLYYQGNLDCAHNCLSVVGSRKNSEYGQLIAKRLISDLLNQINITIVSGLAKGMDSLAHWTAIHNNGKTVAVLGSGFNNIYPACNIPLLNRILEEDGCIISEYEPNTKPAKHHFPARNRIISGISFGTLIIEAAAKSGSLITGRFALEQNREIFAVPGNITSPTSAGTNNLIKMGAKPVTSVDDILENLPIFDNNDITAYSN